MSESNHPLHVPTWEEIKAHPPIKGARDARFFAVRTKRVGEATSGGLDILSSEPNATDPFPLESAHIVMEEVDGKPRVTARSPSGEFEIRALAQVITSQTALGESHALFSWALLAHAALFQRQAHARATAMDVPFQVHSIMGFSSAGRHRSTRLAVLRERVAVRAEKQVKGGKAREMVTVSVKMPVGHTMNLRLRVDEPLLHGLAARPRSELGALVGEALTRVLTTRGVQVVLAAMSLILKEGVVELTPEGELPKAFRFAVHNLIAMPAKNASKAQAQMVRDSLSLLLHCELEIRTEKGEVKYRPLLVRDEYYDAPSKGATRRPASLSINPLFIDGRGWKIPEALIQVADERDKDGLVRHLGLPMAFRIGMGTKGRERLESLARRGGCWERLQAIEKQEGKGAAMKLVREVLSTLRALPHGVDASATDIIGSAAIEGVSVATAVITYGARPAWARSPSEPVKVVTVAHPDKGDKGGQCVNAPV